MPVERVTAAQYTPAALRGVAVREKEETQDARGYQGVFAYERGLVLVRISGDIAAGAETNRITQHLRETIARTSGKVSAFFDLESFHHYHSDVRSRYTDAIVSNSAKVERVWVYADSKLVRMGATVAGLALRQLRLVDRAEFDAELRRLLG